LKDSYHFQTGSGRLLVELVVLVTQDGLVAYLYGGEKPHAGAAVICLPRPSLVHDTGFSCDSTIIPRPGHKDQIAGQMVAEQLCRELQVAVFLAAGIHIDDASPIEIEKLLANCKVVANTASTTLQTKV
jgi:hypothetical protein